MTEKAAKESRSQKKATKVAHKSEHSHAPVPTPKADALLASPTASGAHTFSPPADPRTSLRRLMTNRAHLLQRDPAASFDAGDAFASDLNAQRGSGSPIPSAARTFMEQRFGADFSAVRLHTGSPSAALNRAVNAQAFTHGQDIYLGDGATNVASASGRRLLAHELTHTLQQTPQRAPGARDSLQRMLANRNISRSDGIIQRKISMDGSWAWIGGMGWAETGLDKVWNYVNATFSLLPALKAALGEMRGKEGYRAEDIAEIDLEITRIQSDYDRPISMSEGKALKTTLEKLPLQDKLHNVLSGKKQDADLAAKLRQQEAKIRELLGKLPDAGAKAINNQAEPGLTQERRELKEIFDNYLRQDVKAELSQGIMDGYIRRTTDLALGWEGANQRLLDARRLKEEQVRQAQVEAERLEALKKQNRDILGRKYDDFRGYCNDDLLSKLLAKTTDYDSLNKCKPYAVAEDLLELLDKSIASKLLGLFRVLGGGTVKQLEDLLDNIRKGQEDTLCTLLTVTEDDKSELLKLLKKVGGDATVAHQLMTLAGVKSEKKLVEMMGKGVTPGNAIKLLNTVSGRANIEEIMTLVVFGRVDVNKAIALLNTAGLKGSASDVIDMLAHPQVQNDMTKATSLLSKTGSGTDVMWMLGVTRIVVTKQEVEDIMDEPKFAKDKGKLVATILQRDHPDVSVVQLISLLATYNVDELDKFLDPAKGGQTFASLDLHKTKNIWTGATCGTPNYTPVGTTLATIRGDSGPCFAGAAPAGGRTYGGNRNFGNALAEPDDQLLPTVGTNGTTVLGYTEYDIHPWTSPNRGPERVIVCSDGRTFYTGNHYKAFAEF